MFPKSFSYLNHNSLANLSQLSTFNISPLLDLVIMHSFIKDSNNSFAIIKKQSIMEARINENDFDVGGANEIRLF